MRAAKKGECDTKWCGVMRCWDQVKYDGKGRRVLRLKALGSKGTEGSNKTVGSVRVSFGSSVVKCERQANGGGNKIGGIGC